MLNMIYADIYKMFKSVTIKMVFAITVLTAVLMAVMGKGIAEGRLSADLGGVAFLFSDVNIISILGGVIAGIFICGDFENKTIHEAIACGCSRGKVIISKAAAFFCGIVILLLPYAAVTGIALSLGGSYNPGKNTLGFFYLLANGSGTALKGSDLPKLIIVMITLIIILAAQLSVCIPLAVLLKKPVLIVGIYYGISILSAQLLVLARNHELFDKVYSLTPFGGKHLFLTLTSGWGYVGQSLAVSLFFIFLMIGITAGIFRKAEIK